MSIARAVVFDLYETLITENHPEWHAPAPRPGERLGLSREDFANASGRPATRRA